MFSISFRKQCDERKERTCWLWLSKRKFSSLTPSLRQHGQLVLVLCLHRSNRVRFHVAVRLFSNRSQMTSKCGKNKKVAHEGSWVCHWCSYHILTSSVIYYWIRRTATWNLFVLYNNEKLFFISKINITQKPAICPAFARKKRHLTHLTWSMIYTTWSNFIGCYA